MELHGGAQHSSANMATKGGRGGGSNNNNNARGCGGRGHGGFGAARRVAVVEAVAARRWLHGSSAARKVTRF
jgi:hypothetical protein